MSLLTKKELAAMYGVTRKTMAKKLNSLGINQREMLTPKQVLMVFEEMGNPNELNLKKAVKTA